MEIFLYVFMFAYNVFISVMRLGKKKEKERDTEPRSQNVEGIQRLICSARAAHTTPMRGKTKIRLL